MGGWPDRYPCRPLNPLIIMGIFYPMKTIVHRYIFKEMIPPFIINTAFLMFVFLMTTILDITNLIVNYRVSLFTVGKMVIYSMPFFMEFILPMSTMMAVLLTFLKLSSDNEITALKASGMSLYGMLPPVLVFCLLGYILTTATAVFGLPWGKEAARSLILELNSASYAAFFKERTFNSRFRGMTIYVNEIDLKRNTLVDTFIEDRNTKNVALTITSPIGQIINSDGEKLHLRLLNGMINQTRLEDESAHIIQFETYDIRLEKPILTKHKRKDEEEMSLFELHHYVNTAKEKNERYYKILLEFHKKFSIPFACVALGILAMPLGVQAKTSKRSFGVGLGLIFFLFYYLLLSAGWVFGEAGLYPPLIGMWVPNVVMGSMGLFFLVRTANDKSLIPEFMVAWFRKG